MWWPLLPQGKTYRDLKDMMDFVTNDRNMQVLFQRGVKDAYFPTDQFSIAADSAAVFGIGTLAVGDTGWVPRVEWKIDRQVLLKNHLMVLGPLGEQQLAATDLLRGHHWTRQLHQPTGPLPIGGADLPCGPSVHTEPAIRTCKGVWPRTSCSTT